MLASDQEAAVIALQAIVSAHHQELSAIGRFLNGGDHRVVIVPGNHDADLLWPKVQLALAQAIRPSDTARLLFVPGAVYRHGGVHVEHGHRFDGANRTMNDRSPFALDTQGRCRILASWGEVFVARFFNRTEQRFPFVDNLHPESATLLWALEEEPERLAVAQSAGHFLELLLSQQSRALNLAFLKQQLLNMIGLPAGKDDSLGGLSGEVGLQLLDRFSSEERVLEGIWRVLSDPTLAHIANSLIDAVRVLPRSPAAAMDALSQITLSDIEALRAVLLGDPQTTAATRILDENPALSSVVLGHTHVPGGLVEDTRSGGRTGHYANSGSWIPVARVADLRRSGLAWTSLDVRDRRLFPASFPAVIIDYAGSQPMRPRVTPTRGSFP
jgi:UDP-2,3-diacylglucosamine pyrophosphatase LpxH